jgi:acetate kinase
MKILVLNSGSSSVKFQLINIINEQILAKGMVEKIGSSDAILSYRSKKKKSKIREIREVLNHEIAIKIILSMLLHPQHGVITNNTEIEGIGHRVVHGGEEFTDSILITDKVKTAIRKCIQFAPLHNPNNLKGIDACELLIPGISQIAVFDTAFHHTIPPKAFIYGLPYALYEKLGIRRYGFHGTSHQFVSNEAAKIIGSPLEDLKLITCHLGNGASIAAISGGESIDTSMGFTPLEGLVMGTRCGTIDPALIPYIMDREKLTTKEIDSIMNNNSGMIGLTKTSNDMREIELEASKGSKQHRLALDIYCHSVKKYIGAYMAELGGVDAIIFTGGIGEKSPYVRKLSLSNMSEFDIELDDIKNKQNKQEISKSEVKVLVIPTNEELAIARDTCRVLTSVEAKQELLLEEEKVTEELSLLTEDEKAELILLWAQDPNIDIASLTYKLNEKIRKEIRVKTVKLTIEKLGLQKISKEKKLQIKTEVSNGKN